MFLQILITYLDVITSIQRGFNVYFKPTKTTGKVDLYVSLCQTTDEILKRFD